MRLAASVADTRQTRSGRTDDFFRRRAKYFTGRVRSSSAAHAGQPPFMQPADEERDYAAGNRPRTLVASNGPLSAISLRAAPTWSQVFQSRTPRTRPASS